MILKYKDYYGSVNKEQSIYWGKLLFINDSITYECETEKGLKEEYTLAVNNYLATC